MASSTTDISGKQSYHDRIPDSMNLGRNIPRMLIDLTGVNRIDFNTCPNTNDNYNIPYSSLVHEAGHALGIGFGNDGMDQEAHHSNENIKSAIMSYGDDVPKCSLHPTSNIMAIYAMLWKQALHRGGCDHATTWIDASGANGADFEYCQLRIGATG